MNCPLLENFGVMTRDCPACRTHQMRLEAKVAEVEEALSAAGDPRNIQDRASIAYIRYGTCSHHPFTVHGTCHPPERHPSENSLGCSHKRGVVGRGMMPESTGDHPSRAGSKCSPTR